MAPLMSRLAFSRGFGRRRNTGEKSLLSGVTFTNISPALPGGQTSWNLISSGDLTIFEYSSRSFQVSAPGTVRINLYGAGGGGNPGASFGARGGNVQGIFQFQTGNTYWIHLGQKGAEGPGIGGGGGGGSSALIFAPPSTGTEILVAGGGGGGSDRSSGGAGGGGPSGLSGSPTGGGGGASGTTGGAAGSGRTPAGAGGNAPRGVGGFGSNGGGAGAGGLSSYSNGGAGGFGSGDTGGGGGGGGYAGGGGASNGAGGGGGGGGNGYTNPLVTSPTSGTGGTFASDPSTWGANQQPGAVRFSAF